MKNVPLTLQTRSEKLLQSIRNTTPDNKELHLLIDIIKMQEYQHRIKYINEGKKHLYHFDFFIFEDDKERDEFFDNFHKYIQYYENKKKTNHMSALAVAYDIRNLGFNVNDKRVIHFRNPVKAKMKLDKIDNIRDKRYYVSGN